MSINTEFIYTDRIGYDPEKIRYWAAQMGGFQHHVPDAQDPREWGIPIYMKTPTDCVDYVVGVFKREMGGVVVSRLPMDPLDEPKLTPHARFHLIMVCHAHFLWFRTREGARYIMALQGVEEAAPFTEGYMYYYVDPQGQRFEISERSGMRLRVFQTRQRNYEAPIASGNASETIIQQMRVLLKQCRSPLAMGDESSWQAQGGLYRWVSSKIHDWLSEPRVDYDFPFPKRDRISGVHWIKNAQRSDGQPLFNAIGRVEAFKERAYRIEDTNGAVFWCGPKQVDHFSKVEVARNEGMPDAQVSGLWRCDSCGQVRTCTQQTSDASGQPMKYCKHCIGHFVEKDQRPSLEWCTYRECKNSPDYIRSPDELMQIRTRLNQGARFPVQRG